MNAFLCLRVPYFGGLAYYQCVRHLGVAGLTFVEEDDVEVFFLMMQKWRRWRGVKVRVWFFPFCCNLLTHLTPSDGVCTWHIEIWFTWHMHPVQNSAVQCFLLFCITDALFSTLLRCPDIFCTFQGRFGFQIAGQRSRCRQHQHQHPGPLWIVWKSNAFEQWLEQSRIQHSTFTRALSNIKLWSASDPLLPFSSLSLSPPWSSSRSQAGLKSKTLEV